MVGSWSPEIRVILYSKQPSTYYSSLSGGSNKHVRLHKDLERVIERQENIAQRKKTGSSQRN